MEVVTTGKMKRKGKSQKHERLPPTAECCFSKRTPPRDKVDRLTLKSFPEPKVNVSFFLTDVVLKDNWEEAFLKLKDWAHAPFHFKDDQKKRDFCLSNLVGFVYLGGLVQVSKWLRTFAAKRDWSRFVKFIQLAAKESNYFNALLKDPLLSGHWRKFVETVSEITAEIVTDESISDIHSGAPLSSAYKDRIKRYADAIQRAYTGGLVQAKTRGIHHSARDDHIIPRNNASDSELHANGKKRVRFDETKNEVKFLEDLPHRAHSKSKSESRSPSASATESVRRLQRPSRSRDKATAVLVHRSSLSRNSSPPGGGSPMAPLCMGVGSVTDSSVYRPSLASYTPIERSSYQRPTAGGVSAIAATDTMPKPNAQIRSRSDDIDKRALPKKGAREIRPKKRNLSTEMQTEVRRTVHGRDGLRKRKRVDGSVSPMLVPNSGGFSPIVVDSSTDSSTDDELIFGGHSSGIDMCTDVQMATPIGGMQLQPTEMNDTRLLQAEGGEMHSRDEVVADADTGMNVAVALVVDVDEDEEGYKDGGEEVVVEESHKFRREFADDSLAEMSIDTRLKWSESLKTKAVVRSAASRLLQQRIEAVEQLRGAVNARSSVKLSKPAVSEDYKIIGEISDCCVIPLAYPCWNLVRLRKKQSDT